MTDLTAIDHRRTSAALAGGSFGDLMRRSLLMLAATPALAAARLAWRLLTARAMSSLGALFAAALYGPRAFALMGLYLGAAKLLSLVLFLRYENAALAHGCDRDMLVAVRLCSVLAAGILVALLPALAVGVWHGVIPMIFAPLLVVSIGARGLLRLGAILANRRGDFVTLGRATTVQAIVQPLVLVVLAPSHLHGASVMALADIAGYGIAAVVAITPYRRILLAALLEPIGRVELLAIARRWACLPLHNLPGALFSAGFTALPLIALPFLVDHDTAGHAALAARLLEIPAHLVGAATTPILLHRLSAGAIADRGAFALRAVVTLTAVVLLIFGGALVMSYAIHPFLSSTHWHGLAAAIPVFAVFYAGVTLAGPLTEAGGLFREQRLLTAINGIALAAALAAFAVADGAVWLALGAVAALSLMRAGILGCRIVELADRTAAQGRTERAGPPHTRMPLSASAA